MKTQHLTKSFITIVAALFVMNSLSLGQVVPGWTRSGNKVHTINTAYHVGIGTGLSMSPYKKLEVKYTYDTYYPTYGIYVNLFNRYDEAGAVYGTYILAKTAYTTPEKRGSEYGNVYGTYTKAISTVGFSNVYGGYFETVGTDGDYTVYGLYVNAGIDPNHNNHWGIYVENGRKNYFEKQVGIGTTNPGSYKLAVNGNIRAKEVVVETGWSDFVFEDDYDLMPLEEVEEYIKANKHLPGIPSEEEVLEEGIGLGEMQARLLQKVEELTLYMIELDKENEALKERVTELEE